MRRLQVGGNNARLWLALAGASGIGFALASVAVIAALLALNTR